jgi:hypothetical protein
MAEEKKNYVIELDHNSIDFIAVGCWGVYCDQGEVLVFKEKKKKIEQQLIKRGQKIVADSIEKYVKENRAIKDMFLAGDNVYQIGIKPNEHTENNPLIQKYLEDEYGLVVSDKNSLFNIHKHISLGFEKCFNKIPIERYFIAVGNHDIETCEILNSQLSYNGWNMPSTYYNVLYRLNNNVTVNVIVVDTNMFDFSDGSPDKCDGTKYTDEERERQLNWVRSVNYGMWKIVIGHVPYMANGHKANKPILKRPELAKIFSIVSPQVYMCADEHNQQFLYDSELKMGIVICGTGGTALDENIEDGFPEITLYKGVHFGFSHFNVSRDALTVKYVKAMDTGVTFNVKLARDGSLI